MIHTLTGAALARHATLSDTMFADRAAQFRDRLGWPVTVDGVGRETDQYDGPGALYLVANERGRHAGSMRFLPTTGPTMLAEHFADLTQGVRFASPHIVECTRFCLAPGAPRDTAARLMLAACRLGLARGWSHAVGVFDLRMMRVYARLGWPPAPLGQRGQGRDAIAAGLWSFEAETEAALAARLAPDRAAA